MTAMHPPPRKFDYPFTDADFDGIAALARASFGLNLEPRKRTLVYGRLAKRVRALNLRSFSEYVKHLHGPDGDLEQRKMLSELTTNVTQFFREAHHFALLRETILPDLIARARKGERVRIWSAGCSSGQEPYSLALTLAEAFPTVARSDFRILATDVDPVVLEKAAQGRYPMSDLVTIPAQHHGPGTVANGDGSFSISDPIRNLVTFDQANLMEPWPLRGPIDVIVCRNVAIYFDKPTQETLWKRFSDLLRDGGYLIVGHSERVSGPAAEIMHSHGTTAYVKAADGIDRGKRRLGQV